MDKRIAGLMGAAAALTTLGTAQAAPGQPSGPTPAANYRELLDPIPNAVPLLKADNERLSQERFDVAQVSVQIGHHHHHHHGRIIIKRRYHHHHHHHHHHFHD